MLVKEFKKSKYNSNFVIRTIAQNIIPEVRIDTNLKSEVDTKYFPCMMDEMYDETFDDNDGFYTKY